MNKLYTIVALSNVIFSLNAMNNSMTIKNKHYHETIPPFTHEARATASLLVALTPAGLLHELHIFNRITKGHSYFHGFTSPLSKERAFFCKHGLHLTKNTIYCATNANTIVALRPDIFTARYELPNASTMTVPGIYALATNNQETELAATYSAENKILLKHDSYEPINEACTIRIWDLETQQCKSPIACPDPAHKITYSPDATQIATQHLRHTQIIDLRSNTVMRWAEEGEGSPDSIAYSSDGKTILSYRHTTKKIKIPDTHRECISSRNPFDPSLNFSPITKSRAFVTLGKTIAYYNITMNKHLIWSNPNYNRPFFVHNEEIAIPDHENNVIFFTSPFENQDQQKQQSCEKIMTSKIVNAGLHNPIVSSTGELICRSERDNRIINVFSFQ